MHRAPSVREYLRRRHLAHLALLTGALPAQPEPLLGRISISPDVCMCACVCVCTARLADGDAGPQLSVRNLSSGQLAGSWPLQELPAAVLSPHAWGWASSGTHVALPFGESPWIIHSEDEAGIAFLDLRTGSWTVSRLGPHPEIRCLAVRFCTGRDLLLVQRSHYKQRQVLCVYDFQGVLVSSTELPQPDELLCTWAPAGNALAIQTQDTLTTWVWDLTSPSPGLIPDSPVGWLHRDQVNAVAWDTPESCRVAVIEEPPIRIYAGRSMTFASCQAPYETSVLFSGPDPPADGCAALSGSWLVQLAPPFTLMPGGSGDLLIFSAQDGSFQHQLTARPDFFASSVLELSADGQLCGAVLIDESEVFNMINKGLAVVHLASGRMWTFALSRHLAGAAVRLTWRLDSSAVLVSDIRGGCHQMIVFAE